MKFKAYFEQLEPRGRRSFCPLGCRVSLQQKEVLGWQGFSLSACLGTVGSPRPGSESGRPVFKLWFSYGLA